MRYVGLDWGEKRVGIAISDPQGKIAMPLKAVNREILLSEIEKLKEMYGEFEIVLGLPVRTDGVRGGRSESEALKLREDLERMGIRVNVWKEWFSSVEAEKILKTGETSWKRRRGKVDKVSAALILEAFLRSVSKGDR